MSNIPENAKYTKTHEWVRLENDDTATVGITEHAQESLGDMVFVELPEIGKQLTAGSECGVIESVKSASDVYSPLSGEVTAINEEVTKTPAILNLDPHGKAWLFRVKLSNKSELDQLMDAKAYAKFLEENAH